MCQLLGHHPDIYSIGHSSPLSQALNNLRHQLSDNQFFLSQLDVDFDLAYNRLINAYCGFINGWFRETDRPVVVDKNRGWLQMIDTVNLLDPNFKMIVCLRDLRQIFGSIEARHQKTLLIDFPDHMAPHSAYARANTLFGKDGVIGGPLKAIEGLQDIDESLRQRIGFVTFEALMQDSQEVMSMLYEWLDLPPAPLDPEHLQTKPHESDSYYRFKYSHQTHSAIRPTEPHPISPRIEAEILTNFGWFFEKYYGLSGAEVAQQTREQQSNSPSNVSVSYDTQTDGMAKLASTINPTQHENRFPHQEKAIDSSDANWLRKKLKID